MIAVIMLDLINYPRIIAFICVVVMWLVAILGARVRVRLPMRDDEDKNALALVVSATLTLLGLIIGFTFSMAAARYEQRRLYEENEANAIGTEYVRADLLPAADAAVVKRALLDYLHWRVTFYHSDYGVKLGNIDQETALIQARLWQSIQSPAAATPNPVMALVVSGMNDVLNSQGYTQFSWWNRIPISAWCMMIVIAMFSNLLVGYSTRHSRSGSLLLLVLPLIVSISFFLISDIDSPRGGLIRIPPVDLVSLSQSLPQ